MTNYLIEKYLCETKEKIKTKKADDLKKGDYLVIYGNLNLRRLGMRGYWIDKIKKTKFDVNVYFKKHPNFTIKPQTFDKDKEVEVVENK